MLGVAPRVCERVCVVPGLRTAGGPQRAEEAGFGSSSSSLMLGQPGPEVGAVEKGHSSWPEQGESGARSDKPRPSRSPQLRHAAECRGRERSEGQATDGSQPAGRPDGTSLLPLLTALGTKETASYQGILSLAHAVPVSICVCSLPRSQGCDC